MHLKPLQDRVAVRVLKEEGQTASGIILLDPDALDIGEVVAVGPGRQFNNGNWSDMGINVGDKVLLGRTHKGDPRGQKTKISGEELVVLREADVFAVVVDD